RPLLDPGGLMPAVFNGHRAADRPRGARKKKEAHRWVREARAIGGYVIAAFGLVALATYRATAAGGYGPSGPIGHWLAWALFQAFGYAAFLFPLLLGLLATSTFVRPLVPRGWAPAVGLVIVLISTTALLTQSSPALPGDDISAGGFIGFGLIEALRGTLGNVGAWLVPLAGMPVGVLFVTQVSYGAISRVVASRLRKRRAMARGAGIAKGRVPAVADAIVETAGASKDRELPPVSDTPFVPPAIVEPTKVRSSDKGLAWQETFAFGKNGAQAFQLPPVGLLKVPSATDVAHSHEELQDNA